MYESKNTSDKVQDEIVLKQKLKQVWKQKAYREIDPVIFYRNFRHCI